MGFGFRNSGGGRLGLYILHDEIGGADSLSKMGANVEILSELVPTPGTLAHPFCLNGQNLFCFSEILETDKLFY